MRKKTCEDDIRVDTYITYNKRLHSVFEDRVAKQETIPDNLNDRDHTGSKTETKYSSHVGNEITP